MSRLNGQEPGLEFDDILRKGIGTVDADVATQGACGALIGAGGTAQAEIDAAGVEGLECAELLCNHQRCVIGQHDAAGTDPDGGCGGCNVTNDHRSGCAGDTRHVVMLGQPVAVIAKVLGVTGEITGVAQRDGRCAALRNGCEVEYRERNTPYHRLRLPVACHARSGHRRNGCGWIRSFLTPPHRHRCVVRR
ncbi:hypothetical protein SDC9_150993 [bioreactor metagenome]|uniref:Uncharacterized protein n=1 Tax=bioreactor metagenome TaxID=1076179 RepID=A0A645ERI0_9ZZZZ